jgi:tripartite-type tricarboxylate transporter receptor subunit TctC
VRALLRYGLIGLGLVIAVASASAKDSVAEFYAGKTVVVLNAFGQGGQYGLLARLIATYLPRHLPGRPGGVPQFMPGAAGLLQTNYLYNAAAKDGTVIGLMYDNMPTTQVLEEKEHIKFDARRFGVLGSLNKGESGLVGVLKRTGIASVEDAKHKTAVFGATGTTGGQYQVPNIMNRLFGTRFKLIPGFKTTTMIYLSMERGEVDGIYGAYEVIAQGRPQWIADKRLNWLAQLYDRRASAFPDVPLLQELAQNDKDRAAFRFLALARIPGKIFIAPPGVPPERLTALRTAFDDMLHDPEFKSDFAKSTQTLDPRTWQDAAHIIAETVDTPGEVTAYVTSLLKTEP